MVRKWRSRAQALEEVGGEDECRIGRRRKKEEGRESVVFYGRSIMNHL